MSEKAKVDFADSDREDGHGSKPGKTQQQSKGSDPFAQSLIVKNGRNHANTLYYVDQTKLPNERHGLDLGARAKLLSKMEETEQEEANIRGQITKTQFDIKRLLKEPTNAEAILQIKQLHDRLSELRARLQNSRHLTKNEKRKIQT